MHRSGTSALARVLSLLGCDLPKTLVPPLAGENETGFWESLPLVQLNNDILESAGSAWHDWLPFNAEWYSSPKRQRFDSRGLAVLNEEFGESEFFVLKDPRVCRFLPFWKDILVSVDVSMRIVVPIRHPLEVAASLQARSGFDLELGVLLWLRHVLDAERTSRDSPRHFTSYELITKNWSMVAQQIGTALDVTWPRWSQISVSEINGFLTPKLRHHVHSASDFVSDVLQPAWVRETFRILHAWTVDGERPEDYATLDRIGAELDSAAPAFGRLVIRGRQNTQKAKQLESQVGEIRASLDRAEKSKIATEEEKTTIANELVELSAKLAGVSEALARSQSDLARTEKGRHALEETGHALEETVRRLTDSLNEAQKAKEEESGNRRALEADLAAQADQLAEAVRKLALADETRADLERHVAELEQATTEYQAQLADTMSQLAQTQSALAQRRAEAEETAQLLAEAKEQLTAVETENADAASAATRMADEIEAERRKTAGAFGEIAALTQILREKESEIEAISESARSTRRTFTQQLLETETARREDAQNFQKAIANERALLNEQIEQLSALATQFRAREAETSILIRNLEEKHEEAHRAYENSEAARWAVEALLSEREAAQQGFQDRILWLRQAAAVLLNGVEIEKKGLLSRRIASLRYTRQMARLKSLGLFDPEAYLAAHPDVAADDRDPLRHYILHGLEEGRTRGIESIEDGTS